MLNLFLAILIERFEEDSKQEEAKANENKLKRLALNHKSLPETVRAFFRKYLCDMCCKKIRANLDKKKVERKFITYNETIDSEILSDSANKNISLNLFKLDNKLRKLFRRFILPGSEELAKQMNRMQTR